MTQGRITRRHILALASAGMISVRLPGSLRAASPTTRPQARPAPATPRPDSADAFFDTGPLPRFDILVAESDLKALDANPKGYVRATVRESAPGKPDVVYCDVGIHLKGGPGSFRQTGDKPALTLNFDKFVAGQSFHGLDKIHLNNSVQDGTYMCEYLGSYVFRAAGHPAPRVSNARVWLNGRDLGPFVLKEGFDGVLFRKFFRDKSGNLYEAAFTDIDGNLPVQLGAASRESAESLDAAEVKRYLAKLEADRKSAQARLKELADAARDADPTRRRQRLDQVLDCDRFLTFLACETLVAHWDGYHGVKNNYRIYDDPRTGRMVFLPQGMDQLFQRPDHPLFSPTCLLGQVVPEMPEYRERYLDRMTTLRQAVMTPDAMLKQLQRVSDRLAPLMEEIGADALRQHKEQTAGLRQRVLERIAGVDRQLAAVPRPLKFDDGGVATLAAWTPKQEGSAKAEKVDASGTSALRVTCTSPGGKASWRTTVLLPQGRYTFEGRLKTAGVAATPATGAALRLSGAQNPRRVTGGGDWQTTQYDFEIPDPRREVVLVCELAANSGEVLFDASTLKLRRR